MSDAVLQSPCSNAVTSPDKSCLIIERKLGRMVWLSVADNVVIHEDKFSENEWLAMKKTVDLFGRVKSTD